MANNRKITVDDMMTIAQDMAQKNDARFFKNSDAGELATKDDIGESDLTVALATKINNKADAGTSLADYGIADAYTKDEVDGKLSSVYKPGGSKTAAELVAALLISANEGKVYNASEPVTSTTNFTDGGGKTYPAGTNFVVIETAPADNSDPENPVAATYKFDALAGFIDLSGYASLEDVETASAADITAICNGYFGEGENGGE